MVDDRDIMPQAHNNVPLGFKIFFALLCIWGIWYIWAYTPELSGWSWYSEHFETGRMASTDPAMETASAVMPMLDENPYAGDAAAIAEGGELYMNNCAGCHAEDLSGGAFSAPLTGELKYGKGLPHMYESIAMGRPGGMPEFGTQLGRERILKIIAFIKSKAVE